MKICPSCGKEWPDDFRLCPADGASLRTSSAGSGDLVDSIIADRYHIKQKLGQGGMGTVYLAEHVKMGQQAAIKVISRALASDPAAIARFTREARNAASIRHPNVCTMHDFGETEDGLIYMAMEFVEGESLADLLKREGRLAPQRAASILLQCCDALQAAHDLDIVHRDIKPENIMITTARDGADVVKVVDFGIAKAVAGESGQTVTQTGFIVGTPDYMSPDQVSGEVLDGRSDIYSLAVVFFRMITGALPFQSTTPQEALLARMAGTPAKLRETLPTAGFSPELERVLDRALAQRREQRFATAMDFGRAVQHAVQGAPTAAPSATWEAAETRPLHTPQPTPAPAGPIGATPETPQPVPGPPPRRKGPRIAAAAGVVAIVGGLLAVWQVTRSGPAGVGQVDSTAVVAGGAQDSAKTEAASQDEGKPEEVTTGTVAISGLPDGGRVFAQGRELESPFVLPAGRHEVELRAPGYENKTVTIDVVAGERMTVLYAARPVEARRPPPPPQPRRTEAAARGRTITLGQRVTGTLSSNSPTMRGRPIEAWSLRGTAGQPVEIVQRSDDFDSFLYLQGPGLPEPLEDDDGAGNLHARIRTTLPATGTYTILASTLGEGSVGSYTLAVTAPVDLGTLPVGGRRVGVGDAVSGTLSAGDLTYDGRLVQAWALTAPADTRVEITMRSSDFDAYLFLTGPGIAEPLSDDDGGGGQDARIRATLGQPGTYRVVASQYSASGTGTYTLTVTAPGEVSLPTAGRTITLGGSASGRLGSGDTPFQNRRVQAWELQAPPNSRVEITMRSSAFDPYLYLAGPGFDEPLSNDDGADGNNARITAHLAGGRYLVLASAYAAGDGGPYTLSVTAAPTLERLPRTGRQLSTSTAVTGTLSASDPQFDGRHVQVFELRGSAGRQVQITMRSEAFDTYLYLTGPGMTSPLVDDDGAGGTDSRISTRLAQNGTYLVVAGGYDADDLGAFTLSVSGQ